MEVGTLENNMELWDKLKRPPKEALRPIKGGRLSGKTDINPQWRYEIMTEIFGPCGIGWKYTINRSWTESASEGQSFAFAEISLFTRSGEEWSDPIPGFGGSMLIALEYSKSKQKEVLYSNDEALKMATTDALGVAMKMLGVGADIYKGLWDGAKYANTPNATPPSKTTPKPAQKPTQKAEPEKPFSEDEDLITVSNIEQVDGETNNKSWTRWIITDVLDVKYVTFSKSFKQIAEDSIEGGFECAVTSVVNKYKNHDIVTFRKAD